MRISIPPSISITKTRPPHVNVLDIMREVTSKSLLYKLKLVSDSWPALRRPQTRLTFVRY